MHDHLYPQEAVDSALPELKKVDEKATFVVLPDLVSIGIASKLKLSSDCTSRLTLEFEN